MNYELLPIKQRVVKPNSIIFDTLNNEFGEIFRANATEIIKYIIKWRMAHSTELSTRNVGKRLSFSLNDVSNFYSTAGITKDRMTEIIKTSKFTKLKWFIAGEPFHNLLGNLIFFFRLYTPPEHLPDIKNYNKIKDKLVSTHYDWVNVFLGYKYFSWLQARQFKHGADEDVMDYTLNNMSKKFDIVKAESLMQIIDDKSFTNILYYEGYKRIIDPKNPNSYITKNSGDNKHKFNDFTDENIVDYLNYYDSRLSDFIVNVAKVYYKNHQEGNSSTVEAREVENEEGKKSIVTQTSISNDIATMSRKIILNMQRDLNIDINILRAACKNTQANYNAMHDTLEKLRLAEREIGEKQEMEKKNGKGKQIDFNDYNMLEQTSLSAALVLNIIAHFIVSIGQPTRMIHSSRFISESIKAYSVSNVKDKYILKIKEILDEILTKYKKDFLLTQASSTKNNFRRCVFIYFVMYISKYADT